MTLNWKDVIVGRQARTQTVAWVFTREICLPESFITGRSGIVSQYKSGPDLWLAPQLLFSSVKHRKNMHARACQVASRTPLFEIISSQK
jgi:hypothetical protein